MSVLFIVSLLTKNQKPYSEPLNLIKSVKRIKCILYNSKSVFSLVPRTVKLIPSHFRKKNKIIIMIENRERVLHFLYLNLLSRLVSVNILLRISIDFTPVWSLLQWQFCSLLPNTCVHMHGH